MGDVTFGSEITPDRFPDLGLKAPSGREIQLCVGATRNCIQQLQIPANFLNFQEAAIGMFAAFGVSQSDNLDDQEWNKAHLESAYKRWHAAQASPNPYAQRFADIELRTTNAGYVNVYFDSYLKENRRILNVFPGACSLGTPRDVLSQQLPVRNFYEVFAKTISPDHSDLINP